MEIKQEINDKKSLCIKAFPIKDEEKIIVAKEREKDVFLESQEKT